MVLRITLLAVCFCCLIPFTHAEVTYSAPMKGKELPIGNLLEWGTVSETSSKSFIVERSFDGLDFENIGSVDAAGDSDDEQSYRYLDIEKYEETAFYRLKQLDQSGHYEYSETVMMKKTMQNEFMVVAMSQTTTNKMFDLTIQAWNKGEIKYSLISYKGEIVFEATQFIEPGFNEIQINLEGEQEGIYKLSLQLDEEEERLVIQKREDAISRTNVASKN